jgi:hypothetical protein
MRRTCFGLALLLLAVSAAAQAQNGSPTLSSTAVAVNGQPVQGKVLEVDGKHYVAVEDLAQSLRGTISYSDGQIALTLTAPPPMPAPPLKPQSPPAPAEAGVPQPAPMAVQPPPTQAPGTAPPPAGSGRIHGSLTYFFSFHVGNKPDNGSKVWLVKDRAELPADQSLVATNATLGTSGNPQQYSAIQYAVTDDNGNFELPDVPPGQYTVIVQSAHTKGALKDKRNFFGRGKPDLRDTSGRVEFLSVLVKPGETAETSKDFGPDNGM